MSHSDQKQIQKQKAEDIELCRETGQNDRNSLGQTKSLTKEVQKFSLQFEYMTLLETYFSENLNSG